MTTATRERAHETHNSARKAVRNGAQFEGQGQEHGPSENLRDSRMMAHLLDALEQKQDVGHYGRLVFCMVARHFMPEEKLIDLLSQQPDQDETKARAMLLQVKERNYCPPKRERIMSWQKEQEFPICPDADDPSACNLYRELKFPDGIYDEIQEFYEEQVEEK